MSAQNPGQIQSQLQKPGYNLVSGHDLAETRKHLFRSRNKKQAVTLPLTSMIDMFSMVVIFLIMNFSSNGDAFYVARGVELPKAKNADVMENHTLVSILEDRIYLDSLPTDKSQISFEDREKPYPKLRKHLKSSLTQKMKEEPGKTPKMTVNVQADTETPMIRVKEVIKLLVQEGWTGIQLTVKKRYE